MTYSKKFKSIRRALAMVLTFAMVFTGVYTGDFQVSAASGDNSGG